MHYQFLIEDISGSVLIQQVMDKFIAQHAERQDITFDCKSFRGIGGFKNIRPSIDTVKTNKLLNDLPIYLKGFDDVYKTYTNYPTTIFIVLDNDKRNVDEFRSQLENISHQNLISTDHVFCIAVEEMEAWLLGDIPALQTAYPRARHNILNSYVQDSICGTWEKLADSIYTGGYAKFKRDCPTYKEIGRCKSEWALAIGKQMNIHNNSSPSFNFFINELEKRVSERRMSHSPV